MPNDAIDISLIGGNPHALAFINLPNYVRLGGKGMEFSLRDKDGFFYAGMLDGLPVLYKMKRKEARFDEPLCDKILKQLTGLGYEFEKVPS